VDQNPDICHQDVVDSFIDFGGPLGKGSAVLAWRTTHEVNLVYFNIVTIDQNGRHTLLTPAPVRCEECITGEGHACSYVIPKHKSTKNIFIEVTCSGECNGGPFGPAIRR
jgi:hypothetical protein